MANMLHARLSGDGASGEQPTAPHAQDVRRALAVLHAFLCALADRELHAKGREDHDADPLLDQSRSPLGKRAHCEACRTGKIEGARKLKRRWLARRSAIEAYVQAGGRTPNIECEPVSGIPDTEEPTEAEIAAKLRAAGLCLTPSPASRARSR